MNANSGKPQNLIADMMAALEQVKPASLIYCSAQPVAALEALSDVECNTAYVSQLQKLQGLGHVEMGLVFDFLEHVSPQEGVEFLGRLRNMHCDKIWVAVRENEQWNLNLMISLGFKRKHVYLEQGEEVCTYYYDIGTYNHKREWNSPKNWANPENWGKYWW